MLGELYPNFELLFLTFLLANFAMQVSQLREHGWAYLLVAYNWLSFANVVLFVVIEARRFTLIQARRLPRPPTTSHDLPRPPATSPDLPRSPRR